MPILIEIDEDVKWLYPKANWKTISINSNDIKIDPNFLVYSKKR